MLKREAKAVASTLQSILGIGKEEFGFDGFFYSQEVDHTVTLEVINDFITSNQDFTPYAVFEHFLVPVIQANPTKHQSLKWIFNTLADACLDILLKKDYYEHAFTHYILSRRDGFKDAVEGKKFYVTVLTRDSCCEHCKDYTEEDVHEFDKFLSEFPAKVRNCVHERSCHSAISVMSEAGYNYRLKRRHNER
ncbi:MAG: hypothetical protein EOO43_00705 [Flavobacterium sp.]|nr:MAG: hypothetical protein EOO43_00705 [Flavobacterium sp.]